MSTQHEVYLERAAEARAGADAATLDNVRDRWLRSEASWAEMAARSERAEKMRIKLIAEKAIEREALKAARETQQAFGTSEPKTSLASFERRPNTCFSPKPAV